jgi:hypothetical protein
MMKTHSVQRVNAGQQAKCHATIRDSVSLLALTNLNQPETRMMIGFDHEARALNSRVVPLILVLPLMNLARAAGISFSKCTSP